MTTHVFLFLLVLGFSNLTVGLLEVNQKMVYFAICLLTNRVLYDILYI